MIFSTHLYVLSFHWDKSYVHDLVMRRSWRKSFMHLHVPPTHSVAYCILFLPVWSPCFFRHFRGAVSMYFDVLCQPGGNIFYAFLRTLYLGGSTFYAFLRAVARGASSSIYFSIRRALGGTASMHVLHIRSPWGAAFIHFLSSVIFLWLFRALVFYGFLCASANMWWPLLWIFAAAEPQGEISCAFLRASDI